MGLPFFLSSARAFLRNVFAFFSCLLALPAFCFIFFACFRLPDFLPLDFLRPFFDLPPFLGLIFLAFFFIFFAVFFAFFTRLDVFFIPPFFSDLGMRLPSFLSIARLLTESLRLLQLLIGLSCLLPQLRGLLLHLPLRLVRGTLGLGLPLLLLRCLFHLLLALFGGRLHLLLNLGRLFLQLFHLLFRSRLHLFHLGLGLGDLALQHLLRPSCHLLDRCRGLPWTSLGLQRSRGHRVFGLELRFLLLKLADLLRLAECLLSQRLQ